MTIEAESNVLGQEEVPYDEIDPEIRGLVFLVNKLDGIKTFFSCAGHPQTQDEQVEGYVVFEADSLECLENLMRVLEVSNNPNINLICNRLEIRWVSIMSDLHEATKRARHRLAIIGQPLHTQRGLIHELEKKIRVELATLIHQH